jgi:hypothetical protein
MGIVGAGVVGSSQSGVEKKREEVFVFELDMLSSKA